MTNMDINKAADALTEATDYPWEVHHTGGGCYAIAGENYEEGYTVLITHPEGPYTIEDLDAGLNLNEPLYLGLYRGEEPEPEVEVRYDNWQALMEGVVRKW